MIKMFTTQLMGLLKKMSENEDYLVEDGARLLAQAAIGKETSIYIYASNEMTAVQAEALYGYEPLQNAKSLIDDNDLSILTEADRVLLVTRYSNDPNAVKLALELSARGIPFVSISTAVNSELEDLTSLADIHIDLMLTKGLLPNEDGTRFGFPFSIVALYAYYMLKLTINEMLAEYE